VWFQKISIPSPRRVIGNSEGEGRCLTPRILRESEAKLEFPEGCGGSNQKTLCGGSMDIFWNNTIQEKSQISFCKILYSK